VALITKNQIKSNISTQQAFHLIKSDLFITNEILIFDMPFNSRKTADTS
jgi:hypothetical protein